FFALTGLITAIILGKLFGFDKGTTAGLLSGSLTQSSIMGTAQESIKTLSISYAQKTTLISNVAIAHAVTYIFGFAGVILFYKLIPGLLRINLKKEAKQLETQFKKHTKIVTPKPKTNNSYIIMIGAGCALGIILGLAVINIGVIPLTLGMGGGVLLSGLFFGWLQSAHPFFEPIGKEAQRLLTTGSLNLFIACVGLSVGPRAVTALQTHGLSLFFAGIILALTPHVLGIIFGRLILKLDYVLLLGALTGAGTITPSLQVLKNEAESTAPALGYTVTYALGNFILTLLGTLVIHFM
ncbi:hypothetical protein KAH94_03370, partial [bacterium]|nr:hypothetical protein [bacterium]